MKYYDLIIDTDNSKNHYDMISDVLNVLPNLENTKSHNNDEFSIWTYRIQIDEHDDDSHTIDRLLDLIEPKMDELFQIGINKNEILIWLLYEYTHQCALGFSPNELLRLGQLGIALNIDCWSEK